MASPMRGCTEIPSDELTLVENIGSGGFGEVWTAAWHDTPVAVKKFLNQGMRGVALRQLREEAALHERLRFPFIVQLLGVCTVRPHVALIMELAPLGNMFSLLHESDKGLPLVLRTSMLFDVARGMTYLHSQGVLHRDLKSLNLLLFNNWLVKICDFGLSKVKADSSVLSHTRIGTAAWMAPEIIEDPVDASGAPKEFTEAADVYSFAMVTFEVMSRTIPFEGQKDAAISNFVLKGRRLSITAATDSVRQPLAELTMARCWQPAAADRPRFAEVSQDFRQAVAAAGGDPRQASLAMQAGDGTRPFAAKEAELEARERWLNQQVAKLEAEKRMQSMIERTYKTYASETGSTGPSRKPSPAERRPSPSSARKERRNPLKHSPPAAGRKAHRRQRSDGSVEAGAAPRLPTTKTKQQPHGGAKGALTEVFLTTGGAGAWAKTDGWLEHADLSRWAGVKVELNLVVELDLSDGNLTGPFPEAICTLTSLRVLNLQGNALTGHVPASVSALTKLRYLSLRRNRLGGPVGDRVCGLTNLRELYLFQNAFTGPIPREIASLRKLINLFVHQNRLTGHIPSSISALKSLWIFSAWGNSLDGPLPPELGSLKSLIRLELQSNRLTSAIPKEVGGLVNLQYLYLDRNALTGAVPHEVGSLRALKFLNLSHNELTGSVPSDAIARCKLALRLELQGNRFENTAAAQTKLRSMLPSAHVLVEDPPETPQSTPRVPGSSGSGSLVF